MSEHKKWYGGPGIDTEYERLLISYRPNLIYPEKESSYPMSKDTILQISRSQDFMISRSIIDYRILISRIEELLQAVENRQSGNEFQNYLGHLKEKDLESVFEIEANNCGYNQDGDYEMYTMLYFMRESLVDRVTFLDDYYRTQITSETEDERMIEEEKESINKWIQLEYELLEMYETVGHEEGFTFDVEKEIHELEKKRREIDQLHTTIADTSYIDRNRYMIFESIADEADRIISSPQKLIDGNLPLLMDQIATMSNTGAAKSHFILTFKDFKIKHQSLKQQYVMIDDQKEKFAAERQYMYQQLVTTANDDLKDWLYDQPDDSGRSVDLFASFMVDSIHKTKKDYDQSLADMLGFYKNEGSFYGRQITIMQKKEEIRLFVRIIDDLEEVDEVTDEWVEEYLRINGYDAKAT